MKNVSKRYYVWIKANEVSIKVWQGLVLTVCFLYTCQEVGFGFSFQESSESPEMEHSFAKKCNVCRTLQILDVFAYPHTDDDFTGISYSRSHKLHDRKSPN